MITEFAIGIMEPEIFFCSHATADNSLALKVERGLRLLNPKYSMYFAENKYVGFPLINKLRQAMLDSNALVVIWTEIVEHNPDTSRMISFEVGMAYSLGLPIYLLRFPNTEMPWFYYQVTDFITINSFEQPDIDRAITLFNPDSFIHPIDIRVPKEKYFKYNNGISHSINFDAITQSGQLEILIKHQNLIHYDIINNRLTPERSLYINIMVSPSIILTFDPGMIDSETGVIRSDLFHSFPLARNSIMLHWPTFQAVSSRRFELILLAQGPPLYDEFLAFQISSEHMVRPRQLVIPIIRRSENFA